MVLASLPFGIHDLAREWFDSLSRDVRNEMNNSLDLWIDQLLRRFKDNSVQALSKADSMRHSFADESQLTVREYITKKTQLYYEAGEEQEDLIVKRLHEGLDPTLALVVPLRTYDNSLADFTARVYIAEPAARVQHHNMEEIQYKKMEEMYSKLAKSSLPGRSDTRFSSNVRQDHDNRNVRQSQDRQAPVTSPFRIPTEAARRIANYSAPATAAQVTTTTAAAAASAPTPAVPLVFPQCRIPYPCTHCQSREHIDPQCPHRPKRTRPWLGKQEQDTPAQVQPVHLADATSDKEDDYLTPVNATTYYCYQHLIADIEHNSSETTATPSASDSGKEESGH